MCIDGRGGRVSFPRAAETFPAGNDAFPGRDGPRGAGNEAAGGLGVPFPGGKGLGARGNGSRRVAKMTREAGNASREAGNAPRRSLKTESRKSRTG